MIRRIFSDKRGAMVGFVLPYVFVFVMGRTVSALEPGAPSTPAASPTPTPPPVKQSSVTSVTVPLRIAPAPNGTARNTEPLAGIRALQIDDTQARLVIQGVERVIKIGDRIGADVVKSIAPGRIVLSRPAAAGGPLGGDALVILQFDAQGRTQVLVVSARDTTSKAPGTVK